MLSVIMMNVFILSVVVPFLAYYTQHNDIQHNDNATQHNYTQHNDIQRNDT